MSCHGVYLELMVYHRLEDDQRATLSKMLLDVRASPPCILHRSFMAFVFLDL
jgi:hypothetical protein